MKKIKLLYLILVICFGTVLFHACGQKNIALESLSLSQTETVELYTGDIVTLDLVLNPVNATNPTFTISDYDNSVITVVHHEDNPLQVEIRACDEIVNGIDETTFEIRNVQNEDIKTQCTVHITQLPSQLVSPTGLSFDGTNLVWNAINNTNGFSGYIVNINGQNMPETTNTYYPISTYGEELVCKVKAKGIRTSVDSAFSAPYIFTVLEQPTGLIHFNKNMIWDEVNGAEYYDVSINGGLLYAGVEETYTVTMEDAGEYKLKVRACSSAENVFASNYSDEITVTKLAYPANFKFEQNKATWSSVLGATGYQLFMDGEEFILTGINYTLPSTLTVGAHQFKVIAIGNKVNTIDSNESATISITKLEVPTNLRIENGVITWDENPYAASYSLTINSNPIQLFENSYELAAYPAGVYNFSVQANGDGENFISSFASDTVSTAKLSTPTIQVLNNIISWSSVSNATLYELSAFDTTTLISGTTYSLPENLASGTYSFQVRALADHYLHSNYSSALSVQKMAAPTNISVLDGALVWDSVTGASEYELSINGTTVSVGNKTTYAMSGYAAGSYTAKVRVKGNASSTVLSDYSAQISVTKLASPVLSLDQGVIKYTTIANATGYTYDVNGTKTQNLSIGADNQTLNIKLMAVGDSTTYISSDYSATLSVTQMAKTTDLAISDGILSYSPITGTVSYELAFINLNLLETDDGYKTIVNNGNNITYNLNAYAVGNYSVTVCSIGNSGIAGDSGLYVNNALSNSVQFERLATPTDLRVMDANDFLAQSDINHAPGQVTWTDVASAISYTIDVDGVELNAGKATKYIINNVISAGSYQMKLKANGDGIHTISSDYTAELSVVKLLAPTNLRVEDGLIQWDTTYNQTVMGFTMPDVCFVIMVDGNGYIAHLGEDDEIAFPDDLLVTSSELNQTIRAGPHNIQIYTVPINNGMVGSYQSNCLISDSTAPISVTRIASPLNLRMENSIIKWEKQFDANEYVLVINEDEITINDINVTQYEFNLANYTNYAAGDFNIKIKSRTTQTNCVNSAYSNDIVSTVMEASTVSVQNGVVTWNERVGVDYYELTIDSTVLNVQGATSYIFGPDYLPGSYDVTVRVVGDDSRYITSDYSNTLNVTKLQIPTGLNVEDGKVQFTPASPTEQTGYFQLYIGSTSKNIGLVTWYELPNDIVAGSYEIKVQAMGDSTIYLNSDISDIIALSPVTKLAPPSNVYLESGILKWSSVANANGYYVKIGGSEFDAGTALSFTLSDTLTDINGRTVSLTAGSYNVQVKAIGSDYSYLNSNYSMVKTITKLPAVTNLRVVNGVITWNAISSANVPYKLAVHIGESVVLIDNATEFILDATYPAGDYSIYLVNLGDNANYISSVESATISVTKLSTPANLVTTEGKNLSFDAVTNATQYEIRIIKNGTALAPVITTETTYSISDLSAVTEGTYDFSVRAIGDSIQYINSEYSTSVTITKPATPVLSATYDSGTITGKITWPAVEHASGYRLIYSVIYPDSSTYSTGEDGIDLGNTTTYYLMGSGTYSLQLVAYISYMGIDSELSETLNVSFAVFSGKGTSELPYLIDSAALFNKLSYNPTAYYQLTSNISYTGTIFRANSSDASRFTGTIDGNGFTISNLSISSVSPSAGIVSVLGATGTVKNLTVNVSLTSGYILGGIAGTNYGTITNCKVYGTVANSVDSSTDVIYNGGIAGKNYGTISSSVNYATVHPTNNYNLVYAGGITGYNLGTISQCGNNGVITGNIAGGMAGYNETTIEKSYNKGSVTGNALSVTAIGISAYAGGIAGYSMYTLGYSINNCYNLGTINGFSAYYDQAVYIGGIVGWNTSAISYCFTAGTITGDNTATSEDNNVYAAKFVGYNNVSGRIGTKCYAVNTQTAIPTAYGLDASLIGERTDASLKTSDFANSMGTANWKYIGDTYIALQWE